MTPATSQIRTVLGIESSCDDTAASVVRLDAQDRPEVLSSVVMGQAPLHAAFGGVVPEIAARAHAERLDHAVARALAEAHATLADIDGIAVTSGPGLIGGLVAGVVTAKAIAAARGLPFLAVNHLAGHALSPQIETPVDFPYLMLLVSGGHCQFLVVRGPERFERLGGTIDDAPGEAFDKVAKLLGLPQPGGPEIERVATGGDRHRFRFPRPLLDREGLDLSFSGLKTAVLRARDDCVERAGGLAAADRADIAAGFQAAVVDILAAKSARAIAAYLNLAPSAPAFCVAGGVASNRAIRLALDSVAATAGCRFVAPRPSLCTDNAAMIAWAGLCLFSLGRQSGFDVEARPRWPLDAAAAPMIGGGRRGAKA